MSKARGEDKIIQHAIKMNVQDQFAKKPKEAKKPKPPNPAECSGKFCDPVRVSPVIKFFRWSALILGIAYGCKRREELKAREDLFREYQSKVLPIRAQRKSIIQKQTARETMLYLGKETGTPTPSNFDSEYPEANMFELQRLTSLETSVNDEFEMTGKFERGKFRPKEPMPYTAEHFGKHDQIGKGSPIKQDDQGEGPCN